MARKQRDSARTQAEHDYGTGQRSLPPQLHEMSPESQRGVRAGFKEAMSGRRTREQAASERGIKDRLAPAQVSRLHDKTVTVEGAGRNIAGSWNRMLDHDQETKPGWYFGHNRRLTEVADRTGIDSNKIIDASASMSPQNSPDQEFRAVSAMADAVSNDRSVQPGGSGEWQRLAAVSDEQFMHVTGARQKGEETPRAVAEDDFDLPGFRSAGTNRLEGWRTVRDPEYNALDNMSSAKVPNYAEAIRLAKPDTPLHHEYSDRLYDQQAARRASAKGAEVPERVDMYGLKKGGDDPTDPAHQHPVLGPRGINVPDTWMGAIASGQPMDDQPGSPSPAKASSSRTENTTASARGSTLVPPAEAKALGGKSMSGAAIHQTALMAATQHASMIARHPQSETNIPPVMMQEMTWVHERNRVADSTDLVAQSLSAGKNRGVLATRAARLRSGTLESESDLRVPNTPAPVHQEHAGSFFRGYSNPLDTDSVTVVPRNLNRPQFDR